jgi:tetratricopeptide (TPR) repeat protein
MGNFRHSGTFSELVAHFPRFAEAVAKQTSGDLEGARALYLTLLERPRLTAACMHQLASLAAARGELEAAVGLYRHALRLEPAHLVTYSKLANALWRLGQGAAGLSVLLDQGCTLQLAERFADAEIPYREILQHDPLNYGAHVNLGTCLAQMHKLPEAAQHLLLALRLFGRLNRTVLAFAQSLQQPLADVLAPDAPLPEGLPTGRIEKIEDAVTTLGKLMSELGLPQQAVRCHRLSVALAPGFALGHWNLALALLAVGEYAEGWQAYEWRWHWPGFPAARRQGEQPVWTGQPLAGKKIRVWAEQGFGDTLQFAPLVNQLAAQGAQVSFEVMAPLHRLMAQSLQRVTVVEAPQAGMLPPNNAADFDYAVAHISLPALLPACMATLPLAERYLQPAVDAVKRWDQRMGDDKLPRVGIAWAGRSQPNALRSVPFALLAPLWERRSVSWYSLQVGAQQNDLALAGSAAIQNLAAGLTDFAETAAAVANMDLVITIDSAVAHLAGALGKRTWLMLLPAPDWRWADTHTQDGQEFSNWYPSVQLFRQADATGWEPVVAQLGLALDQATQAKGL